MNVIDDLIAAAHSASPDYPVQEVLIGLHWTAVASRQMGLAATLPDASCCYTEDIRQAGDLHLQTAYALIEYLRSERPLEASLGMAALNSLLPVDGLETVELNARDFLIEQGRDKNVVLVGHFAFTGAIRQAARRLWVLELNPGAGDEPADNAPQILPQADVIALTGSTLSNHTFDHLAPLFPATAQVVMLGPSTPLSPVLFEYGIDVLAGSVVDRPDLILRKIGQASPLHRPLGLRRFTMVRRPVS